MLRRWVRESGSAPSGNHRSAPSGVLDEARLEMLRELGAANGNADLLRALVDEFTTHASARMQELRDAVSRRDGPKLEGVAHGLKGSSSTIGAARLAAACAVLEEAGRSGELAGVEPQLQQIEHELSLATDALRAESGPRRPRSGPA